MAEAIGGQYPSFDQSAVAFAYTDDPGGVRVFSWGGITWTAASLASRLPVGGVAVGLLIVATRSFDRFDDSASLFGWRDGGGESPPHRRRLDHSGGRRGFRCQRHRDPRVGQPRRRLVLSAAHGRAADAPQGTAAVVVRRLSARGARGCTRPDRGCPQASRSHGTPVAALDLVDLGGAGAPSPNRGARVRGEPPGLAARRDAPLRRGCRRGGNVPRGGAVRPRRDGRCSSGLDRWTPLSAAVRTRPRRLARPTGRLRDRLSDCLVPRAGKRGRASRLSRCPGSHCGEWGAWVYASLTVLSLAAAFVGRRRG